MRQFTTLSNFSWLQADNTMLNTPAHECLLFKADLLWTIKRPEYGQSGTINLYVQEYDQLGFEWDGYPGYDFRHYSLLLRVTEDFSITVVL